MSLFSLSLLSALIAIASAASTLASDAWPQFRGPHGDGHSASKNLPLAWDEKTNVAWKTPIHDRGWSSPVVWGDQVWLTTATENGARLYALCLDRDSGKILHDVKLFDVAAPQFAHKFNTYASPTPVIEEGRVYVTFGSPGTACLDTATGRVLWERRDLECNHFRGAGSSPILYGNLLLMHFDGSDFQFVIALDKSTGKTVWRSNRSIDFRDLGPDGKPEADGDYRKAFATPHVALIHGRPTLISLGARAAYGYDPGSGREWWRIEERTTHSASTRPVVGGGFIFYPTGFSRGQLLAIRPPLPSHGAEAAPRVVDAGAKDPAPELAWVSKRSVPNKPSLLLVNDLLFMIDDGGFASCAEASSGNVVWSERIRGDYSASPLHAAGRIYFFSEDGKTTVIAAQRSFEKLAENQLEAGFMASPAVASDALFLRTKTHLYRIQN